MTEIAAAPSVADMLRGFSIEVNPGESKIIDAAPTRLEPGTQVFMTWIPGKNPLDTVGPAGKLRSAGLFPTPHIGARHVESAAQLEEFVRQLVGVGVDRALIIAGDRDQPAGPFDSSLAVMQSGILQKAGITRISVGGFPEGNPKIFRPAALGSYCGENKVRAGEPAESHHRDPIRLCVRACGRVASQGSRAGNRQSDPPGICRPGEPDFAHALRVGLRRGRLHESAHRKAAIR